MGHFALIIWPGIHEERNLSKCLKAGLLPSLALGEGLDGSRDGGEFVEEREF